MKPAWLPLLVWLVLVASPAAAAPRWQFLPPSSGRGTPLLYEFDEASPVTVLQVWLRGGLKAEPADKRGLAYITARLAFGLGGDDRLPALMRLGATYAFRVEGDAVRLIVKSLSHDFPAALEVVKGIYGDAAISGPRIDAVRKHLDERGRDGAEEPQRLLHTALGRAFYGEGGYGFPPDGDSAGRANVSRRDVQEFHRRQFTRARLAAAVSSDRPSGEIQPLVESFLQMFAAGDESAAEPLPPAAVRPPPQRELLLPARGRRQHLALGVPLPPFSTEDYACARLAEAVLGRGMDCRLWRALRQSEQLAYEFNVSADTLADGGIFMVYTVTAVETLPRLREVLSGEWRRLARDGVDEAELQAARRQAMVTFQRECEWRETRTIRRLRFAALGAGPGLVEEYPQRLQTVSVERFNAWLRRVLAEENTVTALTAVLE